ncbi:MAG: 30S ribosomal protein S16 [Planctomycetota bacterium]|jgi:small subunit ribosomal protein S16
MAVKIRMTRMGRRHRPFFRINAVEGRNPRDGRILEKLGHYDPLEKDADKQYVLNKERIEFWIGQGAIASDTCAEIFKKQLDVLSPQFEAKLLRRARAKAIARKQGKPFTEAERIAAAKAIEDAANAEAKAAEDAAAAAKAAEEKAAADAKAAEEAAAAKAAEEAKVAEAAEAAKAEEAKAAKAEETAEAPEAAEASEEKTD